MLQDKYVGLILAISSSVFIGISFVITKKGLTSSQKRYVEESYHYLKNWKWWAGMSTMAVGEILNFSAYSFAPAILVTPLGALSVILGAIFASIFLKEKLNAIGKVGCLLSVVGVFIVVLHAPEEKQVRSIEELLFYALQPGFIVYCLLVFVVTLWMIYQVVPIYAKKTPFVYLSICSLVGSISVMSIKAFGIALKLTLAGNNQFTHPSTYAFGLTVVICIVVQMNYFNKALEQFSTNVVNPIYFVCFTSATLVASAILFHGFNTDNPVNVASLLAGFVVIFIGVYLLDSAALTTEHDRDRIDEDEQFLMGEASLFGEEQALSGLRHDGSSFSLSEDDDIELVTKSIHATS